MMRNLFALLATTVNAALLFIACDSSSKDGGSCTPSSQTKLIGGAVDTDELFKSVFYFETDEWTCSATKVKEDLLLTAGHCVLDDTGKKISGTIYLTNSVQVTAASLEKAKINRVAVESNFEACMQETSAAEQCATDSSGANGDVAFIHVTPTAKGKFASAPTLDMRQEALTPTSLYLMGYGCETRADSNADTGATAPRRKWGQRIEADVFGTSDSYFGIYFPQNTNDAAICSGDSGSPILVKTEDAYKIVGTTSLTATYDKDGLTGFDVFVNLNKFTTFINEELGTASTPTTTATTSNGDSCK